MTLFMKNYSFIVEINEKQLINYLKKILLLNPALGLMKILSAIMTKKIDNFGK